MFWLTDAMATRKYSWPATRQTPGGAFRNNLAHGKFVILNVTFLITF